MNWINIYGLIIMIIIMMPNIVFGIKNKGYQSKYHNKVIETIEQVGRFGSMFFMVVNIPVLTYGYWFTNGKLVYLILICILTISYCISWIYYFYRETKIKAMILAVIPTLIFFVSGIIHREILLIMSSILFGVGHIIITYNNHK